MPIDWFTVGAQVVNFLVLVWLLKRFLYKPILTAIDAREALIRTERAAADATKVDAEKLRDQYQTKEAAFDQDRAHLLQQATDEAATKRQALLADAQAAADALTAKRAASYQAETQSLNKALTQRTQDEVFAIARQTLQDLADVHLEDQVCEAFTHQIETLADQPKSALTDAIGTATGPILLRSAFDLTKAQQANLQAALHRAFSNDAPVQFATAPDLISGIELTVGGQKLAWSISNYLTTLQKSVDEVLKDRMPQPSAGAEPEAAGA